MTFKPLTFTPFIGVGRSGTNVFRGTITLLDGFVPWVCNETDAIWRHGNHFWPNVKNSVVRTTTKIARFLREQISRRRLSRGKPDYFIEKICANSLRNSFVRVNFPEARFIHLVRNGNNLVVSAKTRWWCDFVLSKAQNFFSKSKYAPLRDLPIYSYRLLQSCLSLSTNFTIFRAKSAATSKAVVASRSLCLAMVYWFVVIIVLKVYGGIFQ